MDPNSDAAAPRTRGLVVLLSVVVLDLIGFGIVMPILVFHPAAEGVSGTVFGSLLTAYSAAQFVFAPLWGRLSDRVGRRRVLLGTIAGTGVSLALLGLAESFSAMFAARALAGAFAANVSVAAAYIADETSEDERTRWMGLLGAAFGIGFLLGPALGFLLVPFGLTVPMFAAAALAGLNWLFALATLREPARVAVAPPRAGRDAPRVGRVPALRRLWLANLLFSLAVTQLESMFPLFMRDRFDFGARDVALLFAGIAVVMALIQGGGMRPLAARFREASLAAVGSAVLALAFALAPLAPTVPLLAVILVGMAAGRAVVQPSLLSLVSVVAGPGQRGGAMGAYQSASSGARVVGPLAAGAAYDLATGGPFWLAAVLAAAVSVVAWGLPREHAPESAPSPAPAP